MNFGVNTFIWSASFDQSSLPLLPLIKAKGFDAVEVPLFGPLTLPLGTFAAVCGRMTLNAPFVRCRATSTVELAEGIYEREAAVSGRDEASRVVPRCWTLAYCLPGWRACFGYTGAGPENDVDDRNPG